MNKALIISPTGRPIYFHEDYDKDNHWRYTKPERTYETCVVLYNDFVPEPNTYDMIVRQKGFKWKVLPELSKKIKWEDYDYIGFWDDDYATDIQSINKALAYARRYDFRLFQQATTSFQTYDCLKHNPEYAFTETNFIEIGIPFFRNDIFRKMIHFIEDYNNDTTNWEASWGIDKVMCYYLQASAHVVHETTARHMVPESSMYDKTDAFREMEYLMRDFFPRYMREKFDLEYQYTDVQQMIRAYKNG
jgi:hypothetical protein